MIFGHLSLNEYFIHWDDLYECYYMYRKNSTYTAKYVDEKLSEGEYKDIIFNDGDKVYKVDPELW